MITPDASAVNRTPPMAGGLPISDTVADQAAEWLTLLMSSEATDDDRQRWQRWRKEHPDHERAWQHIETVTGRLKIMQPEAAYRALSPYEGPDGHGGSPVGRRTVVRSLLWAGAAGAGGLLAARSPMWRQATADHHTATGEQRTLLLDDGTSITLNTASAIDVRFDDRRRLLNVLAGEVLIATGHPAGGKAADARPFIVETAQGSIRALGTRFTVRQHDGLTRVTVLDSAVEITPRSAPGRPQLLRAGQQTTFSRAAVDAPQPAGGQVGAWLRGQIVADEMRLGDFITELGRYRPGIVHCDPAVSGLRFSGVFPLHDTDRILSMLPNVLPVQVKMRTRYWVTVEAAR